MPTEIELAFTPAVPTPKQEIIAALAQVEVLEGLTAEEYAWMAEHGAEIKAPPETLLFREGEPVETMNIMLAGEIQVRRKQSGNLAFFIARVGQISGILPFSRMKGYGGTGFSVGDVWVLNIHKDQFPAMLAAIPSMAQRSVSALLNRVREVTRMEQQAEKLDAIGKLAGNLSHELNNPASAAQRAAASLLSELRTYGDQKYRLGTLCLSDETRQKYRAWLEKARIQVPIGGAFDTELDPLQQTDREDIFLRWLQQHKIPEPWTIASTLAETGIAPTMLDELAAIAGPEVLPIAIASFASAMRAERMTEAVLESTGRIFQLIRAIKDYSYMDQAPIQNIHIAQSLDNTLVMFGSRLGNVTVQRDYDDSVPAISAYGSELNQVWTQLIANALDAMEDAGTLRLRTHTSGDMVLVEIWDSGPGIPPELKNRIFEPFFTTKAPGRGLGLGLDSALRIVQKHHGFITMESKPGATCFQVRLPLNQLQAY